jgi:predicted ATP-grasp superfamily ATP-dependent carboligase
VEAAFRELAGAADFTLVIAPEFDGILETCCRWAEEAGGRLLGPGTAAVRNTADKLQLADRLHGRGVPTPPCRLLPRGAIAALPISGREFPAVCKPRHGAGSQATFLVRSPDEFRACPARAVAEGCRDDLILQPFVPGQSASVGFLLGPGCELAMPAASQVLSTDGRFRFHGGVLPLPPDLAERARRLGGRAVQAMPGLRGYVGVDVILGKANDGSGDRVIEINPRLTTSYVGVRALAASNLAGAWLRVIEGQSVPDPEWRAGTVNFRADGTTRFVPPGWPV